MEKVLFALILLFVQFNLYSQKKTPVTEVVVFRVKPQTDLQFVSHGVNQEIVKFDGFIERQTFQSLKDTTLLLDWVTWESLEHAEKAAKELPSHEKLMPFIQSIKKVDFFEHFKMKYSTGGIEKPDVDGVLELVIYNIKKDKLTEVAPIFDQVSTELKNIDGFKGRITGVSSKIENQFVDYLVWEDLEKAKKSMKLVEQNAKILPFFEMNEATLIFEHFKLLN